MSSKITFTQSIQLWWRFALILSGVLIFTSIFTRIILWLSAAITHILSLTPTDANPETYQHIHPLLLHAVCLISISVFILAQIFAIYALVNYNKKIWKDQQIKNKQKTKKKKKVGTMKGHKCKHWKNKQYTENNFERQVGCCNVVCNFGSR